MKLIMCLLCLLILFTTGCTKQNTVGKTAKENAKTEKTKEKEETKEKAKEKTEEASKNNASNTKQTPSNNVPASSIDASSSPVLKAALSYVGQSMSCDQLATMALVDGGLLTGTPDPIFHDGAYLNLSIGFFPEVSSFIPASQAVPGDLIYYDDGGVGGPHVAVYAGNGQAVHGGWNGLQVVVNTVNIGSGPRYMRFAKQTWETISNQVFPAPVYVETPSQTSQEGTQVPNAGSETTYTTTLDVNQIHLSVRSSQEADVDFLHAQMESVLFGNQTLDEMIQQVQANGYTIIEVSN